MGLALVLSGGGARAAYQVGVLRYPGAANFPTTVPDILTGVSAGGINAAFLAARQEPYPEKIEELTGDVERPPHRPGLPRRLARSRVAQRCAGAAGCASGGKSPLPHAKSMVDTTPLREVLERELHAGERADPRASRPACGRLAARVRADRVELHHRPVDHVGADARRRRDAVVGAAGAQEPLLPAARRSRDGVGGAAVLLSGDRSRRRVVRRRRHPADRAAVAGDPPRRDRRSSRSRRATRARARKRIAR